MIDAICLSYENLFVKTNNYKLSLQIDNIPTSTIFVQYKNTYVMAQVRLWVHAVWGTKHRAPLMKNKNNRITLFKHIKTYAKQKKIYLDFINGESDHVHCLIAMACDQNIAQIMKLLKGDSSHFANSQSLFEIDFEWADDYYAVSVSQSHVEIVRNYIKGQEEHHTIKSFEDECVEFMAKYGFIRQLG
jgi:putative transposase